jgi:hypothetical protein
MQFVLFIFQGTTPSPGSEAWKAFSEMEQKAIYADYAAINQAAGASVGLPLGLPIASRTVRVRDGELDVAEGTYLSESAAGYLVLEADTMDAAIELAVKIPAARLGGAIEIRPVERHW